ncbi:MAG: response regulator [Spirochaetales bacterium]|nr:response regulator [Candidatus Physcosoma equi]
MDGKDALRMLEDHPDGYYDLILMDIQMPVMDGYEATKAIRMMEDEKKRSIPILAMTANAFDEDRRNALAAGMDGHLAKPIDIAALLETTFSVLS